MRQVLGTPDDWEQRFAELQRFQKRRGHCRVPLSWPEYRPLAKWALWQREKQGRLSLEQLRRLYDLGFPFGAFERHWLGRFFELVAFKEKHGHCDVPKDWPENRCLGLWVGTQRTRKALPPDRRRRLNQLGFVWNHFEYMWERGFAELKAFYQQRESGRWSRREVHRIVGWPIGSSANAINNATPAFHRNTSGAWTTSVLSGTLAEVVSSVWEVRVENFFSLLTSAPTSVKKAKTSCMAQSGTSVHACPL